MVECLVLTTVPSAAVHLVARHSSVQAVLAGCSERALLRFRLSVWPRWLVFKSGCGWLVVSVCDDAVTGFVTLTPDTAEVLSSSLLAV